MKLPFPPWWEGVWSEYQLLRSGQVIDMQSILWSPTHEGPIAMAMDSMTVALATADMAHASYITLDGIVHTSGRKAFRRLQL